MSALALTQDTLVVLSGVVAAACLTIGPVFRTRRAILLAQLGAALCFATHYAFLGIAVAAAVNIIGSVQTFAALFSTQSRAMNRLGYVLIVLMALIGLWFWQGPISGLSVVAMTLIALARMQSDQIRLRTLLIAGGCTWMVHDVIGEAWIAFAADIGAVAIGLAALLPLLVRVTVEWRPTAPVPAAPAA